MIMIQTQRLAIVRLNDKLETWFIKSYFNKKLESDPTSEGGYIIDAQIYWCS